MSRSKLAILFVAPVFAVFTLSGFAAVSPSDQAASSPGFQPVKMRVYVEPRNENDAFNEDRDFNEYYGNEDGGYYGNDEGYYNRGEEYPNYNEEQREARERHEEHEEHEHDGGYNVHIGR